MQSQEEHQEVPKKEAAARSSGTPKKWHRGWNLVTEHHQNEN
jgi:hypothetical protein